MEDKKLAAIQAAYGDAWEKVKEHVDENGWCEYMVYPSELGFDATTAEKELIDATVRWRPKILSGLEDNNGWIRCDDKLPEDNRQLFLIYDCLEPNYVFNIMYEGRDIRHLLSNGLPLFTHYKALDQKPPIY